MNALKVYFEDINSKMGGGKMWKIGVTIGIWILWFVCVKVMKKIEPHNRVYPVWALFIAISFTLFAIHDWLG